MNPAFWKLSQGGGSFTHRDMLDSIERRLVYVHGSTRPKGRSKIPQGDDFVTAAIGDYFYLTYRNEGIYLLGQFSGPANMFSDRGHGWLDRPFRFIRAASEIKKYKGAKKRWAPSDNSTFTRVPETELGMFEDNILIRHFDITLADYGIDTRAA